LIRMAPGASYHPHSHDADGAVAGARGRSLVRRSQPEAGDFHVATPSSSHPPGRTVNGCLVHRHHEPRPALEHPDSSLGSRGCPATPRCSASGGR
jgi:hypothetical protein